MSRLFHEYLLLCFAAGAMGLFLAVAANSAQANDIVFPGESWLHVSPESVGYDSELLEAAAALLPDSSKAMVVKNGRVIWAGTDIETARPVFSITKSVASTAAGLLIDDGVLALDSRVADYIPQLDSLYSDLELEHLLKQSGGIRSSPFRPGDPLFDPGATFNYNDGADNDALSYTLSVAGGQPFGDLVQERIGNAIGMNPDQVSHTVRSEGTGDDRVFYHQANSGMSVSASNLARYGLLYLAKGEWAGQRLLSEEWIDAATDVQVTNVPSLEPSTDYVDNYGYGWWTYDPSYYNAFGFDNNRLAINEQAGLVVVALGFSAGPTEFGPSDAFLNAIDDAQLPHVWDGAGDGDWHAIQNGLTRWTLGGSQSESLLTENFTIGHDTVTVSKDMTARRTVVESSGRLVVSGAVTANVDSINVTGGDLVVQPDANFNSSNMLLGTNSSTLILGDANVNSIGSREGSQLTVGGGLMVGTTELRDTSLTVLNSGSDLEVSGTRFRLTGESKLTFVVDDSPWDTQISFTADRYTARFSGTTLEFEFSPHLDPAILEGQTLDFFDWGSRAGREFDEIVLPSRIQADVGSLAETGELTITSVLMTPPTPGDFDGDGELSTADIDQLSARIQFESTDVWYDANEDGVITLEDLTSWLAHKGTEVGDTNLDGSVEFDDFLSMSRGFGLPGGWADGDFNADGLVDFADYLLLSGNFQGEANSQSVPEPKGSILLFIGAAAFAAWKLRRRRQQ